MRLLVNTGKRVELPRRCHHVGIRTGKKFRHQPEPGDQPASKLLPVRSRCCTFDDKAHLSPFAGPEKLCCRASIGGNFQISHTAQNSKNAAWSSLSIIRVKFCDFALADQDLKCRRLWLEKCRNILRGGIGDEIASTIQSENGAAM